MPSKPRRRAVATDRRFRKNNDSDFGTPERWQHSGRALQVTERAGIMAARATEEHALDILLLRKSITAAQAQAGFKFKLDYHRARLGPPVTASYSPVRSAADPARGCVERNDIEEAAYRRWRHALKAMGLVLSGAVIDVTCHDMMPRPEDADALQRGLQRLVEWYRLPEEG